MGARNLALLRAFQATHFVFSAGVAGDKGSETRGQKYLHDSIHSGRYSGTR